MLRTRMQASLKVLVTLLIGMLTINSAHAGFATYSDNWPDDASVVNEKVPPPTTTASKTPSAECEAECETIQLSQAPVDRVPEDNHLYVKFGGLFATAQVRKMKSLSQGSLAAAYLLNRNISDNYFTWETGIGAKIKNIRWELEYMHYKTLEYNPTPIFNNYPENLSSTFTNITMWINLIYDFNTYNFVYFRPYMGAMFGIAWNRTRSTMTGGLGTGAEQTASRYSPAWGFTFGARMPFYERWFGYLAYKYNNCGSMKWKDSTGVMVIKGTSVVQGVSIGVQYLLG